MTEIKKQPSAGESLVGQARKLADLVAYQEGAVVSRTVIDKKVGTITIFSFDAGQGLSEHTAPYDAFVYIADGAAEVSIAGQPLTAQAGDMVIMPANQPHALRAVKRFKMLLVMIRA
jgi:quercetin dioxygenase-like cupin family protein